MPIKANFLERLAFFTTNAAPGPILDLAGALAFQALSTAVHLGLFKQLEQGPQTLGDLSEALGTDERGLLRLLEALETLDYVDFQNGRYAATAMTQKWFSEGAGVDICAAAALWDVYLRQLWPHAPQVIKSGERPFVFYDFINANPELSQAFQQFMVGSAKQNGPDIIKKINLPEGETRLLDVGGGHGVFSVLFCQAYPQMTAVILDSETALESARPHIAEAGLEERVTLLHGDMWQADWQGPYHLVLLFNLLHNFDLQTNKQLLQKTRAALKPGGVVAILEQVEGNVSGSATNAFVRLMALQYHLFADGRVYSEEQLRDLLSSSGFTTIRAHGLSRAPGSKLLTAVAG
jgi:ubiquinone/menaquinone biosynthesis C-methylase UbiE